MILKLKKSFVHTQFRSTSRSELSTVNCRMKFDLKTGFPWFIISPQFSVSCTGYQSASEFISRLPAGFSRHWPAKHPPTSPTTAAWYHTRTVADSAFLTLELVSPPVRLRDLVTEVFDLLVLKFGMVWNCAAGSGLEVWPFQTRT